MRCNKDSEDRWKWVLQATSTSSRGMLCFQYLGNLALNHQRREQKEVLDDQEKQVTHCKLWWLQILTDVSSSSTTTSNRSCWFPGSLTVVSFSPTWGIFSFDTRGILRWPRHWKGMWDCCCGCHCHLSLTTMFQPYRECALVLYISADRQPWPSTFGAS